MPKPRKTKRAPARTLPLRPALPPPAPAVPPTPNPYWAQRWAWYLMAFFIPLAGLLIGLFFYDQEAMEARKVGKHSLWIGFIIWVVLPILLMTALFFIGGLALISWVSSGMSTVE